MDFDYKNFEVSEPSQKNVVIAYLPLGQIMNFRIFCHLQTEPINEARLPRKIGERILIYSRSVDFTEKVSRYLDE